MRNQYRVLQEAYKLIQEGKEDIMSGLEGLEDVINNLPPKEKVPYLEVALELPDGIFPYVANEIVNGVIPSSARRVIPGIYIETDLTSGEPEGFDPEERYWHKLYVTDQNYIKLFRKYVDYQEGLVTDEQFLQHFRPFFDALSMFRNDAGEFEIP